MNEDAINRHAEAAEREINYTSARNAFAGFGMGLIERSHSRTWIISKHIKAAVDEAIARQAEINSAQADRISQLERLGPLIQEYAMSCVSYGKYEEYEDRDEANEFLSEINSILKGPSGNEGNAIKEELQ